MSTHEVTLEFRFDLSHSDQIELIYNEHNKVIGFDIKTNSHNIDKEKLIQAIEHGYRSEEEEKIVRTATRNAFYDYLNLYFKIRKT